MIIFSEQTYAHKYVCNTHLASDECNMKVYCSRPSKCLQTYTLTRKKFSKSIDFEIGARERNFSIFQCISSSEKRSYWPQKLTIPFCTLKPSWYFKSGRFMSTVVTGGQLTMFSLTCVWFLRPCKTSQKIFLKEILIWSFIKFPNCKTVKWLFWETTGGVNRSLLLT